MALHESLYKRDETYTTTKGGRMRYPMARITLAAALSATLVASGVPTAAYAATSAELQAQLNDAQAQLQTMTEEAAAAGEALNDTLYELDQTKGSIKKTGSEIKEKQAELKEAQAILSDRVAANYKAGGISLLSLIFESSSFEELVSNIYYADKVSASDAEAIQAVKDVRAELEEKRASLAELEAQQEKLAEQQESQKADLEQRQAEQASYVEGLSAEVQRKLEEERQAELARQEAERKAREEAARKAAAEADARRQAEEEARKREEQEQQEQAETTEETSEESSYEETQTVVAAPTADLSNARQTIVSAAYSQLGVPYVYGASSPGSAFDCSGLTSWCYAQAGISIPHSSAGQAGCIRSTGSLQPGDLVVWLGGVASGSGNHVALYVGDGMIIHANGSYVKLDSLSGRSAYTIAGSVL